MLVLAITYSTVHCCYQPSVSSQWSSRWPSKVDCAHQDFVILRNFNHDDSWNIYGLQSKDLSHDENLKVWIFLLSLFCFCGLVDFGILLLIITHTGNLITGKTTCERFGFRAKQKSQPQTSAKDTPQNLTKEQADQEEGDHQAESAQIGSTLSSDLPKYMLAHAGYQTAPEEAEKPKPSSVCKNVCSMWFGNATNPQYEDTRLAQLKRE